MVTIILCDILNNYNFFFSGKQIHCKLKLTQTKVTPWTAVALLYHEQGVNHS